jgi:hypothetical protein
MSASADAARRIESDPAADICSEQSMRSLLGCLGPEEVVYGVGTGISGIRDDEGSPVLYVVTSVGIRTADLFDESVAPEFIPREDITGQDWTPLPPGDESMGECYSGKRIIFRIWFHGGNTPAVDQVEVFSSAIERLGIPNPR